MQIKILVANRYNNADRTAIDCAEGDVFETSAAYAVVLVADGLAEYVDEPETAEAPRKARKTGNRKSKIENRQSKTPNPFIE